MSNDPDPLTAVPGLVTARNWQGYSVGYADPLPEEVQAAFRATDDASHLGQRLDTLARDSPDLRAAIKDFPLFSGGHGEPHGSLSCVHKSSPGV
ncbi:MAG TPA: hypothetical protein VF844_06730 [Ktedonobacteraceae bacterium]